MSKKFVRNITDIEDINKQEKDTNIQNDILSTNDKDVYIRTGEIYHELTNTVKNISVTDDEYIKVKEETKGKDKYITLDTDNLKNIGGSDLSYLEYHKFKPLFIIDSIKKMDILNNIPADEDSIIHYNNNYYWKKPNKRFLQPSGIGGTLIIKVLPPFLNNDLYRFNLEYYTNIDNETKGIDNYKVSIYQGDQHKGVGLYKNSNLIQVLGGISDITQHSFYLIFRVKPENEKNNLKFMFTKTTHHFISGEVIGFKDGVEILGKKANYYDYYLTNINAKYNSYFYDKYLNNEEIKKLINNDFFI